MPRTLLEFFVDEATDYLDKLERTLEASDTPDADELRRVARALRGSARLADQEAISRIGGALQAVFEELDAGRRHWSPELRGTIEWALAETRDLVGSVSPPSDLTQRVESVVRRLGQSEPPPPPTPDDDERFRRYLGTELRGLASDIGDALGVLEPDPRNREPLKRLLRRIRPLRGIEGVDEIPAVGPAIAAVEEVILRIADTSASVGPGHLVLFRRARQALDDVATELIRGARPDPVIEAEEEIEDLKEQVLEESRQDIAWISDLYYDEPGPHIESSPMADRGAGSWEEFFKLEATGGLDKIDNLRTEMAREPSAAGRLAPRLASTFRQLRERAVTFGHPGFGRVARGAGATVRAAVGGPTSRLQGIAVDLAVTVAALRSYLEASDPEERERALTRASNSLEGLTQPTPKEGPPTPREEAPTPREKPATPREEPPAPKEEPVPIESLLYEPVDAIERARSLWSEAGKQLRQTGADLPGAHALLEEALALIEHALVRTGSA